MSEFKKVITMLLMWLLGMGLVVLCQWIIVFIIQAPPIVCGITGITIGIMGGLVINILATKIRRY